MVKHYINNETEWNNISSLVSGDIVEINSDFSFTSAPTILTIGSGVILDGRNHTLTFDYTSIDGLVYLQGGTIRNLHLDGNSNTLAADAGSLVAYNSTNDSTYGTVTTCSINDVVAANNCGGLLCRNFGRASTQSSISFCSARNVTITDGGICGTLADNVVFTSCFSESCTFPSGRAYVGGICGSIVSSCTFSECYSEGTLGTSSSYNGGILGLSANANVTITLEKCYFVGSIQTNYQGGLIGRTDGAGDSTTEITNCYTHVTSISATYAGGFIGMNGTDTTNITNSYSTNSSNGAFIGINASLALTLTLTNTYTNNSTYIDTGSGTVTGSNLNTNLTGITSAIDSNWSSSIWTSVSSDQPILSLFENTDEWDGTYTAKNSTPLFASSLLSVMDATSCLLGTSLILTQHGYKRLDKLDSSIDKIMTGRGNYAKILKIGEFKNYKKELFLIPKNMIGINKPHKNIILTGHHKFYHPKMGWIMPRRILATTKFHFGKSVSLYHVKIEKKYQHEGIIVNNALVETWM